MKQWGRWDCRELFGLVLGITRFMAVWVGWEEQVYI